MIVNAEQTQKTKLINESTEMKVLRKIAGKSRREKIRSSINREECEIEPIKLWINDRRLNWNDHIDRMENSRLLKKVRDWLRQQKRPLGRPRLRWKDVTLPRN